MSQYSEQALIERPAIALLQEMGWAHLNCMEEVYGPGGTLGRESPYDVILEERVRRAVRFLNPGISEAAVAQVLEELTRDRGAMSPAAANREVHKLLKDGVKVEEEREGEPATRTVRLVDWDNPKNNDFLLTSQLWVTGELYKRRADLVGFVNGIPLVFVELKASHRRIKDAYEKNLADYKDTIPHLFRFNAFIILSNGSESRLGTLSADWDHFNDWKKIADEGEEGVVALETMLRGVCEPRRLLELVENFILYTEAPGGLVKLIAKNHQYLGVLNAVSALKAIGSNRGRLGVFWHTQGSGKSYSMIFFAQMVQRKMPGDWTFVIVTDRQELDGQIYKNFARAGAITEPEVQAESSAHLRELLGENHRYVFTLIQKFRTEQGQTHPVLSERSNIIVVTDEAHRSQYDTFALNMRNALPNAAFIGFTGTPLMAGEEKTRQVFGEYVSVYNFRQSVEDGATVPLYYENRIPELQLTNPYLNEEMEALLDAAMLDEAQEKKLEKVLAKEYHLITRNDRLEKVAEDIVTHFMGRGNDGKAMVVCIDKATAVRMYDKVQKYWKKYQAGLKKELAAAREDDEKVRLTRTIQAMETTDMAVVVSQSQGEVDEMRQKGLDIEPHRRRMVKDDLEEKFKKSDDPFRIVFVCAMWMTGFDVPSCSTIYLDKPMRNHTLMQTIARANRVWGQKTNGLIVDYVGIFRDLKKALAIYGPGPGGADGGDTPVQPKEELIKALRRALEETTAYCTGMGVDLETIRKTEAFRRVAALDDAADRLIVNDEAKRKFMALANRVTALYKAILPDPKANEFTAQCKLIQVLGEKIRSLMPVPDIVAVLGRIEDLLDRSVAPQGYILPHGSGVPYDLSKIDFDKLRKQFEKGKKRIEAERLRHLLNVQISVMLQQNKSRVNYYEKFQALIDEYNSGSINVEKFFEELMKLAQELNEEEKRHIGEQLTEEELALFDLLTKPDPKLTRKQELAVKKVARELLESLKKEKLVLDWRKKQQARAAVLLTIEEKLDELPPEPYPKDLYQQKCTLTYQHVYDSYYGSGQSIYGTVA